MELLPFSFREFLKYRGIEPAKPTTRERATLKRNLEDYIQKGGFPEVVKTPEISTIYLNTLYSSIITKDIIARHNIRYLRTFREMATTLISNFSALTTFNKLKKVHGLKSAHTAKNYVDYLTEAYLVFLVEKYSPKPKEIANSPKKVYGIDTGLINTMSVAPTYSPGRLIENLVFLELMRQKSVDPSFEIFYWRDYQDREIDFVIRKGNKVINLIQVTYVSSKNEISSREIRSLIKGAELLDCKHLMVITWDFESEECINGNTIIFRPLWKWLLGME